MAASPDQHIQDSQLDGLHRSGSRGDPSGPHPFFLDGEVRAHRHRLSGECAQTAVDQRAWCPGAVLTGFRRGNLILPWRAGTKEMEVAPFHRVRNRCALLRSRNPYGPESQGSADRLSRRREGLRRALPADRNRGNGASLALAAASAAPARSSSQTAAITAPLSNIGFRKAVNCEKT